MPYQETRVNIAPYVHKIQQEGYSPMQPGDCKGVSDSKPLTYDDIIYDKIKPELHALFVEPSDLVMEDVSSQMHQPKIWADIIEESLDAYRPLQAFANYQKTYLIGSTNRLFNEWILSEQPSLQGTYLEGLDNLISKYNKKMAKRDKNFTPYTRSFVIDMLIGAAEVGIDYMRATVEVIPGVYQMTGLPLDPKEMTRTAYVSFPHEVLAVAMSTNFRFLNLADATKFNSRFAFGSPYGGATAKFNPAAYHLEQHQSGGFKMVNHTQQMKEIEHPTKAPTTPKVGCPAAYGKALGRSWEMFLEVAPQAYERMLR